jgi:2'-5' RNA ligase
VTAPRTAVIVPVPEGAPLVDEWHEQSTGMPPHVTVLFPFVTPISADLIAALEEVFAAVAPFKVCFRETGRFAGVLYLAPEPAQPFAELTAELVRRWPGHPPYGEATRAVVPHLTVAQGGEDLLARAEADVRAALPIDARVDHALLLEEGEPWRLRARLPFVA